jgi:hypothetical protein
MEKDKLKKDSLKTTYKKYKVIDIPIYGGKLVIGYLNEEELKKEFDIDYKTMLATTYSRINYKSYNTILINFNFDNKYQYIDYGIIAHECVHFKNFLFERIGFQCDTENDEAEAYLIEWVMNQTILLLEGMGFKEQIKTVKTYKDNAS